MHIFATENMEEVKGSQQTFDKLFINGKCLLDDFEEEIRKNKQHYSEYKTILSYMNMLADGQSLPRKKFREIEGKKPNVKRYEFKSKNLRVYAFNKPNGKIVVIGGYKSNQDKDITQLNAIVTEFLSHQPDKRK